MTIGTAMADRTAFGDGSRELLKRGTVRTVVVVTFNGGGENSQSLFNVAGLSGDGLASFLRACQGDGWYGDDLHDMAAARVNHTDPACRAGRSASSDE